MIMLELSVKLFLVKLDLGVSQYFVHIPLLVAGTTLLELLEGVE